MHYENSYPRSVFTSLSRLGAAIFFNQPEVTISSLCYVVHSGRRDALPYLSSWQIRWLWRIGVALKFFWPNHLLVARNNDIATSSSARMILGLFSKGNPHA